MARTPIVFFGSGPVAAKSLQLLAQDFDIEAVVTKPRPAHHRGDFPVLSTAESLGLPIHTVTDKQALSELIKTKPFQSKLGVLIDFGIIVSQDVIDYFPNGIINSHFSLLPEWRGADPITFAILSGQLYTGVSLMLVVEALDEGPIIDDEGLQMDEDNPPNATELTEQLITLSHQLLTKDIPRYLAGELRPLQQDSEGVSYSRKITKADGLIDWTKSAEEIERQIRAFIEWPKSHIEIGGKDVIILRARALYDGERDPAGHQPGEVFVTPDKYLAVKTGNGLLLLTQVKPAGKQAMSGEAFLAGYKV